MSRVIDEMVVRMVGDGSSYFAMLKQAQAEQDRMGKGAGETRKHMESLGQGMQGFGQSIVAEFTAAIGVTSALGTAIKSLKLASQEEANVIDFGTMLQSVEAGEKMVRQIQVFAAKTPLGQGDIQQAAKTLLQFGTAGRDVIPILKQLGDVTGGEAQKFNQMALAMGQMSSTGRLMGQDLLQMINAGFNPLKEISRTTGKGMSVLKDEMEKGRITVDMVRNAFKTATEEGGSFFGLMEKRSKSASGLWSTMIDDIEQLQRAVGKQIIADLRLKEVMESTSSTAQKLTAAFNDQPRELRTTTFAVIGLSTALGVLGVALPRVAAGMATVTASGRALATSLVTNPFAWAAGAAVAVAVVADHMVRTRKEAEALDNALKNMGKGSKTFQDAIEERGTKVIAGGDVDQMARAQKEMEDMQRAVADELNDLKAKQRRGASRLANTISGAVGGPQTAEYLAEQQHLKNLQAEYDKMDEVLENIRNKIADIRDPNKYKGFDELMDRVNKVGTEELRKIKNEAEGGVFAMLRELPLQMQALDARKGKDWYFNEQLEKLASKLPAANAAVAEAREKMKAFRILTDAQDVRESLMTPEQKLADEVGKLGVMLRAGALSWEEYGKAAEQARNRILGAAAGLTDATEVGTNAARVLMYQQTEMMRGPRFPMAGRFEDIMGGAGRGGGGPGSGAARGRGDVWDRIRDQSDLAAGRDGRGPDDEPNVARAVNDLVKTLSDMLNSGVSIGIVDVGGV